MNSQQPQIRFALIIFAATLLLAPGCARRAPVVTPHPYPGDTTGSWQTEQPQSRIHPASRENPLAMTIRKKAGDLVRQGRPADAAQVLERGLRIAPKNGWLWSDLAAIRLGQNRFDQAATLARKADALARNKPALRQRNRQIIKAAEQKNSSLR